MNASSCRIIVIHTLYGCWSMCENVYLIHHDRDLHTHDVREENGSTEFMSLSFSLHIHHTYSYACTGEVQSSCTWRGRRKMCTIMVQPPSIIGNKLADVTVRICVLMAGSPQTACRSGQWKWSEHAPSLDWLLWLLTCMQKGNSLVKARRNGCVSHMYYIRFTCTGYLSHPQPTSAYAY